MLRKSFIGLVASCGLLAGIAGVATYGPLSPVQAQPAPAHPEMHAALEHLREAKKNLKAAAHDYEGHRVNALNLTDQAIQEVEKGLEVAK